MLQRASSPPTEHACFSGGACSPWSTGWATQTGDEVRAEWREQKARERLSSALWDAWWLDTRPLSDAEIDWLLREGVTLDALFTAPAPNGARVVFEGGGFRFAGGGGEEVAEAALIFREPRDLVAWQPRTGALAAWRAMAAVLGEGNRWHGLGREDGGLPVHASPLDWLRERRRGVVVVRLRDAAWLLEGEDGLVCADLDLAERMRAAMRPRLPKMLVREVAVPAPDVEREEVPA